MVLPPEISTEFNPDCEYGQFATTSDTSEWKECATALAREVVPCGHDVMIAVYEDRIAWRYPVAKHLVPSWWQCEVVTL